MALRQRGGKWHYRFQVNGREYAETTGLEATRQNRKSALDIEAIARQQAGGRQSQAVLDRAFNEVAADFLDWADAEYRSHPNSAKRLRASFASAKEFFADQFVSTIDAGRIDDYKVFRVNECCVKDITLRHDLHALSLFFKYGIKHHICTSNPIEQVSIPSDEDAMRMHVLTYEEEQDYFSRAAQYPNLHDASRLILEQGMRPEEVTTIRKRDVNLMTGELKIPRGKSKKARRTLKLTTKSTEILVRRMGGKSQWIFPSERSEGLDDPIGRLNNAFDSLVGRAAREDCPVFMDFVMYDLRHTFATRAAENGMSLDALANILGHSSLRTVQRYVHTSQGHMNQSMAKHEQVEHQKMARWAAEHSAQREAGITQSGVAR